MSKHDIFKDTSNQIEELLIFAKEMRVLNEELEDMQILYKELKSHYDKVKNSKSYGVLDFIGNQTKNLISLKMAIISLIKEVANIKKIAKELEIKSDASGGTADLKVLQSVLNILKNNSNEIVNIESPESVSLDNNNDSNIDDLLDSRIKDIKKIEFVDPIKEGYRIVFDNDKTQYILDSENNVIDDYEVDPIEVKFKKSKKSGKRYAKDSNGNKYEVVDISEYILS